jgi:hypothetical protein
MNPFCTDLDLINWEPNICRDAAFASQTLMSGTADLSGTTLTIATGSFLDAHVEPNQVVVLSGSIAGSFAVVSIDSATSLTISVLYDALFGDAAEASPVGSATGLGFVIRTFWPQRQVVSEILQQAAGILPGDSRTVDAVILNPQALRGPCILGTLQLIYSALAAIADAPREYAVRAELYERLYRRALHSTLVEIDLNGDGIAECRQQLDNVQLVRR